MSAGRQRLGFVVAGLLAVALSAGIASVKLQGVREAPIRHIVQKGDSLSKVAKAYGVPVDELRAWNRLKSDVLHPGQELVIPEGGAAPGADPARPTARKARGAGPRGSEPRPGVATEGPCLPPPDLDADEGMAASAGLDPADARARLRAATGALEGCLPLADGAEGVVTLRLHVACSGAVAEVEVTDDGGLPAALSACVADVAGAVRFSPHALPDGDELTWPVELRR